MYTNHECTKLYEGNMKVIIKNYDLILGMYDMIPSDTKRMNLTILYDAEIQV